MQTLILGIVESLNLKSLNKKVTRRQTKKLFRLKKQAKSLSLNYRSSKTVKWFFSLFGNMNIFSSVNSARQKHSAETER